MSNTNNTQPQAPNTAQQVDTKTPATKPKDSSVATSNCLISGKEHAINSKIQKLSIGLGWDKEGDIDMSTALLNIDREAVDYVWWKKLQSDCRSVKHSGDDRVGDGAGDDETIEVNFELVPFYVYYILFVASIHIEDAKFHNFEKASLRLFDFFDGSGEKELCSFPLPESKENAMLLGVLYRKQNSWTFRAVGKPATGNNIQDVFEQGNSHRLLQKLPRFHRGTRHITVEVVRGRNLAAKDCTLLSQRESSSDPYYTIKYKGKTSKSTHVSKNLNPHWASKTFDLGDVEECEMEQVKVEIFDYDFLSADEFMGCVQKHAGLFYSKGLGSHEQWFTLRRSEDPNFDEEEVSGDIQLKINVSQPQNNENTTSDPPHMS